ncbi:hypothetical protein Hanom_Chr14g01299151 [Helianthus anomalus]
MAAWTRKRLRRPYLFIGEILVNFCELHAQPYCFFGKQAFKSTQLQQDKKMHTMKCVVNKASYSANGSDAVSSSSPAPGVKTPHPTTPAQKGSIKSATKRQLEFPGKQTENIKTTQTINKHTDIKLLLTCRLGFTIKKAW